MPSLNSSQQTKEFNYNIAEYEAKKLLNLTDISQGSVIIAVAPKNFCAFIERICDNSSIVAIFVAVMTQGHIAGERQ